MNPVQGESTSGTESTGREPAARFDIVAVASSAGGITALGRVLGALPAGFPVPVLVVQHLDPRHRTVLADVLNRQTDLPVKLAEAGESAQPGTIYIAPPDRHLLAGPGGTLGLSDADPVNFVRPSADLLFESLAGTYGPQALACVLTGSGRDGAMGVEAVKARGGTVIAQDPVSAQFKGMPQAAVSTGAVDYVLALEEIGAVLRGLIETGRQ